MPTFDALLFDLDGVLVDSHAVIARYWTKWALRNGLDPAEVIRASEGRRTVDVVRIFRPGGNASAEAEALAVEEGADTNGLITIPGAREAVEAARPGPWAVVTSGTKATAETRLRFCRYPAPPVLITANDVSEGKPHPEGYLAAADRLGVDSRRCLVIEDADAGIEAAVRAGMAWVKVGSAPKDREGWSVADLTALEITWRPASTRFQVRATRSGA